MLALCHCDQIHEVNHLKTERAFQLLISEGSVPRQLGLLLCVCFNAEPSWHGDVEQSCSPPDIWESRKKRGERTEEGGGEEKRIEKGDKKELQGGRGEERREGRGRDRQTDGYTDVRVLQRHT